MDTRYRDADSEGAVTEEQKATARRWFVHEDKSEAQIATRLGVPLDDVQAFVRGGHEASDEFRAKVSEAMRRMHAERRARRGTA